jgi:arabinose-5-phosphate isomerase
MPTAIRKSEGPHPLSSARRTIGLERAGLDALEMAFDGPAGAAFEQACQLIEAAAGRVIVMGMGKSGHIGAKIAATLASTGTPAFFVHPAEASHGDLGMITESDVILALSWSGETEEFRNVVFYSRRFRVPLVAVTSRPDSTLARAADVALILPRADEACPHGLAPTTSSLLQLALGDALAIALLEGRGFTADDFSRFHPGGSLGASLAHVSDIMHIGDRLPLAPLGTMMGDAILLISKNGFGCVVIVDDAGALVGIVTDGDLRRHLANNILEMRVEDIMTASPKTIEPEALVASALEAMNSASISALVAVKEGKPVGIVHMHDLLRIGVA